MPRHRSENIIEFLGPGAITSFFLNSLVISGGMGISFFLCLMRVLKSVKGDEIEEVDVVIVLGRVLDENNKISRVFKARLDFAFFLYSIGVAKKIFICGGLTGNATISEAEAGKRYLIDCGVKENDIMIEDKSRHTLENLKNARDKIRKLSFKKLAIVSDSLHLARARDFARGFGLNCLLYPAYNSDEKGIKYVWRAIREAFLLHWYHTGVAYSKLIKSEKLLKRVT